MVPIYVYMGRQPDGPIGMWRCTVRLHVMMCGVVEVWFGYVYVCVGLVTPRTTTVRTKLILNILFSTPEISLVSFRNHLNYFTWLNSNVNHGSCRIIKIVLHYNMGYIAQWFINTWQATHSSLQYPVPKDIDILFTTQHACLRIYSL